MSRVEGDAVERLLSFLALVASLLGEENTNSSALAAAAAAVDATASPCSGVRWSIEEVAENGEEPRLYARTIGGGGRGTGLIFRAALANKT